MRDAWSGRARPRLSSFVTARGISDRRAFIPVFLPVFLLPLAAAPFVSARDIDAEARRGFLDYAAAKRRIAGAT